MMRAALATLLVLTSSFGCSLLHAEVLVPDPIALYPLNCKYGTKEISGKAPDGIPQGVQLATGPHGDSEGAYEFSGTANSFIEFPNNGYLDTRHSMTMLCWVNTDGQDGPLFNYKTSGQWGVHLWIVQGKLFARFNKRNYAFTAHLINTVLTPGKWWFVGTSYDSISGNAKLWVDGHVVQTLNIGSNLLLATQDDVRMGVKTGDGRFFKGRIAEMRIYNVALNRQQMLQITAHAPLPEPVIFYPLNAEHGTKEISDRAPDGIPHNVQLATGPHGESQGSYEFAGNAHSFIEFPNQGKLDTKHSMTMLCWVNTDGQDGPLFNYKTSGQWGVHLWIVQGKLFARFNKRNYAFTAHLINTVLTPGKWWFVGTSYDSISGNAKLWVDGHVVQTLNIGPNLLLATQDDARMGVKSGDGRYFKGRIAQMRIYDRALSEQQIHKIEVPVPVPVPDPIVYYPLDGKYGTKEISDRAADGIAHGVTLAPGPYGKSDGSYDFAGNAQSYIEFPNNGELDTRHSMTMLCWVYPAGQDGPLFNYKTSGQWGVHLWIVQGKLFARFNKRNYAFTTYLLNTVLTAGQWWFIGASYDSISGNAKLWVDGHLVQTLNIGSNLLLATQDDVRMGVKDGDGRHFNGRITQMRVYKVALSQEQIKQIKDPGPLPKATAYYPLNGYYGTREIRRRAGGFPHGVKLAIGPDGQPRGSYEFGGNAHSYIEFPNNGYLDTRHSMTMLCWVNTDGQDGPLFNYKTSGQWGVHLWIVQGKLFARFNKRNYAFTAHLINTVLTPGKWWFVGTSYDSISGNAKLWVDGHVVQTLNIGPNLLLATQDDVRMGVKAGDGRYFRGRITQMRVYSFALSQEHIKLIEDSVALPEPMAFYPLSAKYKTNEIRCRAFRGKIRGVKLSTGPFGAMEGSYEFAGNANSYIEIPNSGKLDARYSMTILCWINPGGKDGPIFSYKTRGVDLLIDKSKLVARFSKRQHPTTTSRSTGTLLTQGEWWFVGASYDCESGDAKLWVNGHNVQTLYIGKDLELATQGDVRMGVQAGDGGYLKARIAQMRVYKYALSQKQIMNLKETDTPLDEEIFY